MRNVAAQQAGTGRRPSIRDVARLAGVSPGCVSNVVNGRRARDDEIGRAVLSAVEQLGYRANAMASNLRRGQSRIIGLVIPDFQNPFFAELVSELERCAEATDYRIVAASSRESAEIESREIGELLGWRVAGMLLAPAPGSRSAGDHLASGEVPYVLVDRFAVEGEADGVGVDNAEASGRVMDALIGLGHRRILVAYLGDALDNVSERLVGVRAAAEASGAPLAVDYLACGPTVESARQALEGYLEGRVVPSAIFCLYNPATLAAYGALQARGLVVGRDAALVSFDDSAWMAHVRPAVAAVAQPVAEIARAAWDRLLSRIGGSGQAPAIIRVPCRFEPRETMVPPPEDTEH